jgi:nicotinic acid mononucleotide adenylyltransferase
MQTHPLETYSNVSYEDIQKNGHSDPTLVRQANLVLGDPFYSHLYKSVYASQGHQEAVRTLIAAGCIDDLLDERMTYPTHFYSAPYTLVKRLHEEAKEEFPEARQAVVISTGSYDPLHEGHMESLIRAKEYIESNGNVKVIAGFMSPSHDAYVRLKNPGGVVDFQRIHDNTIFVENAEYNKLRQWIFHENWETLGVDIPVNFSDVVLYIDNMVKTYVAQNIDVYYIFGSDNAAFGLAFTHNDPELAKGICIGRPGYNLEPEMEKAIAESSTLFYTQGFNGMSSTQVRALRSEIIMPEKEENTLPFVLRDDTRLAANWLSPLLGEEELAARCNAFNETVESELTRIFPQVKILNVEDQLKLTEDYLKANFPGKKTLSFDAYFEGDKTLRASRLFDISSSQSHGKNSHYTTPIVGEDTNEYVFVDDDIVSGFFLSEIKQKFNITDAVSMADLSVQDAYFDIADSRDFLIGALNGGLMMDAEVPFRAPYLSPFVDLISRLSMPADDILEFNRAIWNANAEFYAKTGLTVADLPKEQSAFLTYMGFGDDEAIADICRQYTGFFQ